MVRKVIKGRVWRYGDNINTDIISPGQYMQLPLEEQAKHAMEGIDPQFTSKVKPGDILVAGDNFGSGSSRETAPLVLKYNGIGAVIARSFARIFYRNAINVGLPVLELAEASEIQEGDELEIELITGRIKNLSRDKEYQASSLPEHLMAVIEAGGLEAYLAQKLGLKVGSW
ncbi:3-isopropylmalate dehydratase small subunit [Calderihabitans maritimus]|uniref:3-isopropylmalate dehydratase small subunit n=1 Tax=Calderihabitans maritimus TaxID=1246530 RepID=A0A1Z5HS29_9FIRM|nr:3-isopropylmalate dehydratase small subunit [Calderihabitans maritimus]GAW92333.1 3-isopropylmalate dehydratase small subunit [Calderihabitans maritimus]